MTPRRVAARGAAEDTLDALAVVAAHPDVRVLGVFTPEPARDAPRVAARLPNLAARVSDDPSLLAEADVVIDPTAPEAARPPPEPLRPDAEVVAPLSARLRFAGRAARDEVLSAFEELRGGLRLPDDPGGLLARLLDGAIGATGAEGGSLLVRARGGAEPADGPSADPAREAWRVAAAVGLDPALRAGLRVQHGRGVAGFVAATGRPLKLRGPVDPGEIPGARRRADRAAALCLPLHHAGRAVGVLCLHHGTREDAFDDDDLAFAETLGRVAAEIADRLAELSELRRAGGERDLLSALLGALAAGGPVDERLARACDALARRLAGPVALWRATETGLRRAGDGRRRPADDGGDPGARGGIAERALRAREPILLGLPDGGLAAAAVPITTSAAPGRLLGILALERGPGGMPEGEARAAGPVLAELAAALSGPLLEEERDGALRRRAAGEAALAEAHATLATAPPGSARLRAAAASARRLVGAEHVVLRLRDARGRFTVRALAGRAGRREREHLFALDRRVARETLRADAARWLRDLAPPAGADGAVAAAGPDAAPVRAALAVPLRTDDRVVGTIVAHATRVADAPEPFTREDLDRLERHARVAAAVLAAEPGARPAARREAGSGPGGRVAAGAPFSEVVAGALEHARRGGDAPADRPGGPAERTLVTLALEESPPGARDLLARVAEGLAAAPSVLAAGRIADDAVALLIAGTEAACGPRLAELARRTRALWKEARDAGPGGADEDGPPALAVGSALWPRDADDASALLRLALRPRLRVL